MDLYSVYGCSCFLFFNIENSSVELIEKKKYLSGRGWSKRIHITLTGFRFKPILDKIWLVLFCSFKLFLSAFSNKLNSNTYIFELIIAI